MSDDDWDDWGENEDDEESKTAPSPANRNKFMDMMKENTKNLKIETCTQCGKDIPPTQLISIESQPFHKTCLKCEECNKVLSLGNYASLNRKFYCKPHFKQLFQSKGNYHSGFGGEDPKAKWQNNPSKEE